jgi:hypothetical protein
MAVLGGSSAKPDLLACARDGPPGALGFRWLTALLLPEVDDLLEQVIEMRVEGLDLRRIARTQM